MIHKTIKKILRKLFLSNPLYLQKVKELIQEIEPSKSVFLEYPVNLNQRYTLEKPHLGLMKILETRDKEYISDLEGFLSFKDRFRNIPLNESLRKSSKEPTWINEYIPGLDLISLYGYVLKFNPKLYMEVGSGNSTKIAKRAIDDFGLATKIISIDPAPRAEINEICDQVIRKPLEEVDLSVFDDLEEGDILFIDNSHRVFMNSDVTTVFLDVIPNLKKGVIVQIHDILLPFDYPQNWSNRFYSEQYMLANLLLYGLDKIEILLPCFYVSQTKEIAATLNPIWDDGYFAEVEKHGGSFWFRKI
ncbi:hypothetical protein J2X69_003305 [Algoriphagus sp. 4150]|uniref:class I SAM-dependent methyltransferase n=1 Tax=Algoriphagus sp. 4150 TaxID=2817756 RepID=UPI00285AD59C|nr:class I SAM-dependent methyltransferase [Algoriphagus sp. 4150]MDR7130946.1 hypothetical protein [Algoriphagus sp. 4150]